MLFDRATGGLVIVELKGRQPFDRAVAASTRLPNLIMPGVAKCGTTTLHDILVRHPEICGGFDKELRFLLDRDDDHYRPENVHHLGLAGWGDRFPAEAAGRCRYRIDASPQYQYQATAPAAIAAMPDKPRLMFIVRQPSRRLFSLYRYVRYSRGRLPNVTSFARFVDALRRPHEAPVAGQRMLASALADSRYDEMLERWSRLVPPEHVWVTSLEALDADRAGVLANLAAWLGIDPAPWADLGPLHSNPTQRIRNHMLLGIDAWLSGGLPDSGLLRRIKNLGHRLLNAPLPAGELEANADLLAELDREFAPSVDRFNRLAAAMQPGYRPLAW